MQPLHISHEEVKWGSFYHGAGLGVVDVLGEW
jgi:hypothetical protein